MSTEGWISCSQLTAGLPSRCLSSQVPATKPGTPEARGPAQVFLLVIFYFLLTVVGEVGVAVVHVLVGGGGGRLPCDQSQLRSVCQVDGHDETTTWDSNATREFFEEESQYNKRIC